MTMPVYYNDNDPDMCEWTRQLILHGIIAEGDVDERPIQEVCAADLRGYKRWHFFNGISGWELALQAAKWPDDRPVMCGSAPCQPFSTAGKRKGHADERHLWPEFARLIRELRPPEVFGEQVASAEVVGTELEAAFVDAVQTGDFSRANRCANRLVKTNSLGWEHRWVDGVQADMAEAGYTFRHMVLPACVVGAPHIRQRLYWYGRFDLGSFDSECHGRDRESGHEAVACRNGQDDGVSVGRIHLCRLSQSQGRAGQSDARATSGVQEPLRLEQRKRLERDGETGRLSDAERERAGSGVAGVEGHAGLGRDRPAIGGDAGRPPDAPRGGLGIDGSAPGSGRHADQQRGDDFWSRFALLPYRDGKTRRVEPEPVGLADGLALAGEVVRTLGLDESQAREILSTFPLARDFPGRRMLLSGYGNAICIPLAAAFVLAAGKEEKES